jgi:hypothetical protein
MHHGASVETFVAIFLQFLVEVRYSTLSKVREDVSNSL